MRPRAVECRRFAVELLRVLSPNRESAQITAGAPNLQCRGIPRDRLKLLRKGEAMLRPMEADSLTDATTDGRFRRGFTADDLGSLTSTVYEAGHNGWSQRSAAFLDEAVIDIGGVIAGTTGQCR